MDPPNIIIPSATDFSHSLVGEGGRDAKHRGRVRGLSPRIETPHPASLREATFSHKGRREEGRLSVHPARRTSSAPRSRFLPLSRLRGRVPSKARRLGALSASPTAERAPTPTLPRKVREREHGERGSGCGAGVSGHWSVSAQLPPIAAAIQRARSPEPRNSSATRSTPAAVPLPCATATRRSQRWDTAMPTAACREPSGIVRS
jgi:hypothetical protein